MNPNTCYPSVSHEVLIVTQACNFAIDLNELQSILKDKISMAQQCYQKSTDVLRSPAPDFKVGDKVFVKAQFF